MFCTVDAFDVSLTYTAKRSTTIENVFNFAANKLGLQSKSYFGLQALHKEEEAQVWIKPSKNLLSAVQKNMIEFEPTVQFYLRAKTFPDNFDSIKQDTVAMRLFYHEISHRWSGSGYKCESNTEICLLSLQMLIEFGPLKLEMCADTGKQNFINFAKQFFVKNNKQLLDLTADIVVQLWQMLSTISIEHAILNYVSIATSSDYPYEAMTFTAKKKTGERVFIEISCNGIMMPAKISTNEDIGKSVPLSWPLIRKVLFRKNRLILHLLDAENSKIIYRFSSRYATKMVRRTIVAYHRMHLRQNRSHESTSPQCILYNLEHFLKGIVSNLKSIDSSSTAFEELLQSTQIDEMRQDIRALAAMLAQVHEKVTTMDSVPSIHESQEIEQNDENLAPQKFESTIESEDEENGKRAEEVIKAFKNMAKCCQNQTYLTQGNFQFEVELFREDAQVKLGMHCNIIPKTTTEVEQETLNDESANDSPEVTAEQYLNLKLHDQYKSDIMQDEPGNGFELQEQSDVYDDELKSVTAEDCLFESSSETLALLANESSIVYESSKSLKEEEEQQQGPPKESTRRQRFAKLRLSLFEHERF